MTRTRKSTNTEISKWIWYSGFTTAIICISGQAAFAAGLMGPPSAGLKQQEFKIGTDSILFGPGFALRQTIWMRYNIPPVYRHI
jgi:hypothetical protein